MANYSGKHYYKRSGDSFYTCEHYDIKDMFQRKSSAQLELNVKDKIVRRISGGNKKIDIVMSLMNKGRNFAKAPLLRVELNEPYKFCEFGLDGNRSIGIFQSKTSSDSRRKSVYMGGQDINIYPDLEYDIDKITLEISENIDELPKLILRYMIVAENMEKTNFKKEITVI